MIVDKRKLAPKNQLAEGGEALIYSINPGKVLKIYKTPPSKEKEQKLKILVSMKFPREIIAPSELAYDNNGVFIGYEMPEFSGDELKLLSSKKYRLTNGITNDKASSILKKVKDTLKVIHGLGVVVGDLNNKNILFNSRMEIGFIDVDSWTLGSYKCDVCMDSFRDPLLNSNNFNKDTDYFSFAIMCFLSITKLHPFGGTYQKDPSMNITQRMFNYIPLIDNNDVIFPKVIGDYHFMSPELLKEFKEIFTSNNRFLIDSSLDNFLDNLKFCSTKKDYCSSRYLKGCPICTDDVVVFVPPIELKTADGYTVRLLFGNDSVKLILDDYLYLNESHEIKSIAGTFSTINLKGTRIQIHPHRNYHIRVSDKYFNLNEHTILKQNKSLVKITENGCYYVTPDLRFSRLKTSGKDVATEGITTVAFNNIFEAVTNTFNKKDHYLILNDYGASKIINIDGYNYVLKDASKITDYGIHYNHLNDRWLIILENQKYEQTILILDKNVLKFDSKMLKFSCPLTSLSFYGEGIFIPKDKAIRGLNYKTNSYKDISCDIVNESSKITRVDNYFLVQNEKEIYKVFK